MSYDFTAASEFPIEKLRLSVNRAFQDIRDFECRKSQHMKEEAQWRIYHALRDCADLIERITPKEATQAI